MEMTELPPCHDQPSSSYNSNTSGRNVFSLLAQREVSPRTKHVRKWYWGESSKSKSGCSRPKTVIDAKCGLHSWAEAKSLRHLSAKYCPLVPPPRSTIAAAFSTDGKVLASTHGDRTVKIIDCETGNCLKVLAGHRRTPWVVRFHPLQRQILASGSLDQEVRLWDANGSEWILSHYFYRPIASLAFHANGEIIAVASGQKLYMWHYNDGGEASSTPAFVLKTRRSLRAVHFHPHGAPYLLTAQVNDLDSSDSSMTVATSHGYLQYPPPAVFVTNIHPRMHINMSSEPPYVSLPLFSLPSYTVNESRVELQHASDDVGSSSMQVESSSVVQFRTDANATDQCDNRLSNSEIPTSSQTGAIVHTTLPNQMQIDINNLTTAGTETCETESEPAEVSQHENSAHAHSLDGMLHESSRLAVKHDDLSEFGQLHQFVPPRDSSGWELPFLQGWLMGQSQVGVPSIPPHNGGSHDSLPQQISSSTMPSNLSTTNVEVAMSPSELPSGISITADLQSGLQNQFSQSRLSVSDSGNLAPSINAPSDGSDSQTIISRIQSELATSLAAAAAAELPFTVKLKLWSYDIKNPRVPLQRCRLTIPHVVLCSEMGAHFSPCGRFLAACVACMHPHIQTDPGLQTPVHQEPGVPTSPTRHPISAHQVMYELRIYSMEEATFGSVLVSRAIRAAHCLTSIQFSPTSEHILLAYGRRHGSLLISIVIDGETTSPIYTVLEVYRVSDMELVRVLPSAGDEVNVACFHPFPGGGLVYGTKEGKLRVFQFDRAYSTMNGIGSGYFPEENIIGVS